MKTVQRYVQGTVPSYYRSWNGYWGRGWGTSFLTPGTSGYYTTDKSWLVQVNAYSLQENKLLWAANTQTINPGNSVSLYKDVCNAALKQMKKDGFFK